MSNSRMKNSVRNMFWGVLTQLLTFILQFASRTVFVRTLGQDYLGISGLFSNVLSVLCFAELGIGNAIIFSMYKPMAEDDHDKINALMHLYRKASYAIGITVLVLGIIVAPFLPFIIRDQPDIKESIYLLYGLYLLNSVLSYFYNYKRTIISVAQLEYINILYYKVSYAIQVVVQMVVLVVFKNFVMFLWIQIICTFLFNYTTAKKADRMFPYIKQKSTYKLSKEEIRPIIENVKALVLYKVANVIQGGTDNVIISALVSVKAVGIASNYLLITNSLSKLLSQGTLGISASIGNFNALESKEKQIKVFNQLYFLTAWLYGFLCIGLMICLTPLVQVWFGDDYIFGTAIVFSLVSQVYITGIQFVPNTYRTTLGLLSYWKITPLVCTFINIALSIVLGKLVGVFGILIATTISRLVTTCWVDPYILFHHYFKKPVIKLYGTFLLYSLITIINYYLTNYVVGLINIGGWTGLLIKVVLCTIVCNLFYCAIYCRNKNFLAMVSRLRSLLGRKIRK